MITDHLPNAATGEIVVLSTSVLLLSRLVDMMKQGNVRNVPDIFHHHHIVVPPIFQLTSSKNVTGELVVQ